MHPTQPPFAATAALLAILATGCATPPPPATSSGYYGGDRPPASLPTDLDAIPNAIPRPLPRSATGNHPYTALGKRYHPLATAAGYQARGTASWYGRKFHGRRTSGGEPYNMFAMTAAHPTLPLPTFVQVTNLDNGKSIVVKVNDRGPFLHGRIIDLSYIAAHKLGIAKPGTGEVEVRAIIPKGGGGLVSGTAVGGGIGGGTSGTTAGSDGRAIGGGGAVAGGGTSSTAGNGTTTGGTAANNSTIGTVNFTTATTAAGNIAAAVVGISTAHADTIPDAHRTILIQVGAYARRANAHRMHRRLTRAGYPTTLTTNFTHPPLYRVRTGPHTPTEAQTTRQKLESLLGKPVSIIHINPHQFTQ